MTFISRCLDTILLNPVTERIVVEDQNVDSEFDYVLMRLRLLLANYVQNNWWVGYANKWFFMFSLPMDVCITLSPIDYFDTKKYPSVHFFIILLLLKYFHG